MEGKRAAQRSQTEWDRLVDSWSTSGQTQAEFARIHGINPRTFQGRVWKSRKRRGIELKGRAISGKFVEVSPPVPVAMESKIQGGCRITLINTSVEFSSASDAERILEILSRLKESQ